ncbi:MAG: inosose dehydratase [Saprospiraceae bacterium]|jgi:inosose dehydratase
MQRREFIQSTSMVGMGSILNPFDQPIFMLKKPMIAVQQYTWLSYLRREGITWNEDLDRFCQQLVDSGFSGFEPSFTQSSEVESFKAMLPKFNIWTSSMYVNSTLHDPDQIESSISNALSIAKVAKKMGIKIVVTNPSPIKWGDPIDKTDDQLILQAKSLNRLGSELRKLGMKLAYHTHDMEMRQSAREFHHMLLNSDKENVHLCLDSHWVYRGAGNSQVALFDIIKLYGDRIVELHLRQSKDGVWSEVFGEGDIDHDSMIGLLSDKKLKPHIVLEQGVEKETPQTMSAIAAIKESLAYTVEICQPLI